MNEFWCDYCDCMVDIDEITSDGKHIICGNYVEEVEHIIDDLWVGYARFGYDTLEEKWL